MFVLRTGLQGNGKTLNTIKEVDLKAAKEEREVYYHNIRGFNPNADVLKAVWTAFDDPHKWYELPHNSIIVIDEAQTFFRIRKQASAVPEYASALETMRHKGHELHCITQSPGLIDHHFRKLCNAHIHYVRGHKGKVIKRWEFERVNPEVERKNNFKEGESTRILLDKKYFGVYQSVANGSEHHMRFKPPKALFVLAGGVLLAGYLGYSLYSSRLATPQPNQTPSAALPVENALTYQPLRPSGSSKKGQPLTTEEYIARYIPRIADVPSSAPIYDEVTKAVTYPKLSCMATTDVNALTRAGRRMSLGYREVKRGGKTVMEIYGCRCNTQQGTRAVISAEACLSRVENGAFDPAKPDNTDSTMYGRQAARSGTGAGAASTAPGTEHAALQQH